MSCHCIGETGSKSEAGSRSEACSRREAGSPQCQMAARNDRGKAPLIPLPVITVPFSRLAFDVVGPLPRTKSGYKYYILTCMCYASKYPEAIPLKKVDAQSVAEVDSGSECCKTYRKKGEMPPPPPPPPPSFWGEQLYNNYTSAQKEISKLFWEVSDSVGSTNNITIGGM